MMPKAKTAFPKASERTTVKLLERLLPNSGASTSRGTTARSWKSSTPKDARPKRVPSWRLSLNNCRANAEEERARPPPTKMQPPKRNLGETKADRLAIRPPVRKNWAIPSPKTSLRIAITFRTESSKPVSKRKKMIPNSAMRWLTSTWRITSMPAGPRTIPISRKPKMGEVFSRAIKGTTKVVAKSKINPSFTEYPT